MSGDKTLTILRSQRFQCYQLGRDTTRIDQVIKMYTEVIKNNGYMLKAVYLKLCAELMELNPICSEVKLGVDEIDYLSSMLFKDNLI